MTPLSPQDQMFLLVERRNQPMHVGSLMLLSPPPDAGPNYAQELADWARSYTKAQPPFNQLLTYKLGLPFWTDDTEFDLEAHFHHISLPKPGRIRELLAIVSKLHSGVMDRAKPLWEIYIIDGVEDGRVAVYSRIHHALVDGVAGMRMLQRSMSPDPAVRDTVPFWAIPPRKRAPADGVVAQVTQPLSRAAKFASIVKEQASTWPTVAREIYKSIKARSSDADYVSVFQAPRTILNQPISASRRFAAQSWHLPRIKAAAKRHNATLNDIVLAMCAAAVRKYLIELNALPDKPLVAMVPMSLRKDDSEGGNQVGVVLANLATHLADPLERLDAIARSVQNSKDRFATMNQLEIMNYVATAMAVSGINMATGIAPTWQAFNIVVSNVPGPRETLYWNGAKLEGIYPVSIAMDGQATNITVVSYAEKFEIGIIACRRTLPHMQKLLQYLEDGLAELEA
ncbi:MAG: wax ester/triacylglycerol synthase family O-acyltransferase [Pseudomonadota bacterium]